MRLIFEDPARPQDRFVINDRTDDGDPIVCHGETFAVSDESGRRLIADHFPRLKPAPASPKDEPEVGAEDPAAQPSVVSVTAGKDPQDEKPKDRAPQKP